MDREGMFGVVYIIKSRDASSVGLRAIFETGERIDYNL